MDTQRSRRRESTSPLRVNLAERGKPVSFLRKTGKKAVRPTDGDAGKGVGKSERHPVVGWRTGCARFGQHHPPRKRADFPTVSRHENQGGIDTEGVANDGGSLHWCSLPREGIAFSVVSCSQQVVSLLTGPLHGL